MAGGLSVCGRCGKRLITTMQHGRPALKCTKIVNGDGACGSMVIGHDDLETYVFDVVMKSLDEKNPRLRTRLAEQDPADDAKIAQLEAHRDDLRDQKSRADDLFIRGALSEREHAQHVERVRVETDETTRQIDALLGTSIMTDALADGLDWRSWSPERRRNFLRVLIQRVEVHEFPKGMGSYVRQRSGETVESFAERKLDHRDALMGQRVVIVS
ncbi:MULTISPECIES: zinc ribbon domain-containing protein [unclassified Rathayibacter]|nr:MULTISPECIES: zinc ribbon domain-containing protein [unclassified Rathayibacter]MCJ1703700.1 zinc ribbon domain-containing protein [Rathayibacter sp. VKM Ac-2926]